jgi:hypothetical protein
MPYSLAVPIPIPIMADSAHAYQESYGLPCVSHFSAALTVRLTTAEVYEIVQQLPDAYGEFQYKVQIGR